MDVSARNVSRGASCRKFTYSELFFKNYLMMSQSRDKKSDNKLTTPPSLGRNIVGDGSIVLLWDGSKSAPNS